MNILEFQSLSAGYAGKPVLADITLSVKQGEAFGVIGESGSGKSTLLRAVLGTAETLGGEIVFDGQSLYGASGRTGLLGRGVTMICQNPESAFDPLRTYRAQFRDTLCSHGLWRGKDSRREILELFSQLGLEDGERVWRARPWELSGGMNQRAAIALTVLLRPKLLLADEPTSALDVDSRQLVCGALGRAQELTGSAILLVTHDLRLAGQLCSRIAVLHNGEIVESGPAAQVLESPQHPYTRRLTAARPRKGQFIGRGDGL